MSADSHVLLQWRPSLGPRCVEIVHVSEQEHARSTQLHRSKGREVVVVAKAHTICVGGIILVDNGNHARFHTCSDCVADFRPALLLQKISLTFYRNSRPEMQAGLRKTHAGD